MLLKAIEAANNEQKAQLDKLLKTDNDNKIGDMLALYTATGADKHCRQAVQSYSDMAFSNLEEIEVSDAHKQPLFELASYLLQRDK